MAEHHRKRNVSFNSVGVLDRVLPLYFTLGYFFSIFPLFTNQNLLCPIGSSARCGDSCYAIGTDGFVCHQNLYLCPAALPDLCGSTCYNKDSYGMFLRAKALVDFSRFRYDLPGYLLCVFHYLVLLYNFSFLPFYF